MNCTCEAKNGYDHADDCPAFMRSYVVPVVGNPSNSIASAQSVADVETEQSRREQIVRSNMPKWFPPDFVNWMFSQLEKLPSADFRDLAGR